MKLVKGIVVIIIAAAIAVASACIASSAKKNLDPEQMKVWVEGNVIYLEYPDGNVWAHEVK